MATGWQGKQFFKPLPADWPKRREYVLARDGRRCQHVREDTQRKCLTPGREVDHIIERSDGGSDATSNLQVLCTFHHTQKTGRHAGLKSAAIRAQRRRSERPKHPGIIG